MTLIALLTTPEAYRKVQAEIDAFYAERAAPEVGAENIISYSEGKSLLYLQGALREALRLWPPPAGLFSKQVPKGGDTVLGFYLPEGTEVGQSMYGIGRRRDIWGEDVDIFRPDRWTEASPERLPVMQAANDIVFSTGKYLCLGKPVAWMEMIKFFAEVCGAPVPWQHLQSNLHRIRCANHPGTPPPIAPETI